MVGVAADWLDCEYGVGVGRKGVISGSGDGGSEFFSVVSKEKTRGSEGVSSASIFSGSEASSGSGSSSSFGSCSSTGSGAIGVAVSPALAPPHDMHDCLESGLSAPHADHVQIRVSTDSTSKSGSFCFVLRFIDGRFMASLFGLQSCGHVIALERKPPGVGHTVDY